MGDSATTGSYHWLALYYDQLFTFRSSFDAARRHVLGPILPSVRTACDLACGTGTTAVEFARAGIGMAGVDLSPTMCRLARRKAREAGVPLQVLHADMRSFRLPEPVDLVTCEYDALNHVPRKGDLDRVAKAVARALKPGGHFFFDVNNRIAFERVWPLTWWVEKPDLALVMHGGHVKGKDKAWCDVELFVRRGRYWKRHKEHVEQVCWNPAEIRRALRAAGLDRIRAWDASPFVTGEVLIRPGHRTFYLARKVTARASRSTRS